MNGEHEITTDKSYSNVSDNAITDDATSSTIQNTIKNHIVDPYNHHINMSSKMVDHLIKTISNCYISLHHEWLDRCYGYKRHLESHHEKYSKVNKNWNHHLRKWFILCKFYSKRFSRYCFNLISHIVFIGIISTWIGMLVYFICELIH